MTHDDSAATDDIPRHDGGTTVDESISVSEISDSASEPETATEFIIGPDSNTRPVISVVMPTMNEEQGIETCIEQIEDAVVELQVPTEIIVSDNSDDQTPDIAHECGASVVESDTEGYGYAYQHGFEYARGEYIVMGDADTTYDFSQIPMLLEHLQVEEADIVIGSRFEGKIIPGAMPPLHQYVGNPILTRFLNIFYDTNVTDAHSGFRVFRRDILNDLNLRTSGMEFASEMIMAASAQDLVIAEAPIVYYEREGEETLNSFQDGWRHVRFMLTNAPAYLFLIPGPSLGTFGLLVMFLAWSDITIGSVNLAVNSMIAGSLFTIVGYQIGSLGVFALATGNPIQHPNDPITNRVTEALTPERGALIGLAAFSIGTLLSSAMIYQWILSGFATLGSTRSAIFAFTLVVVGLQTVFSSFFLSIIAE